MKNDKQNELLRLLARSDRGVPAATLASMLGISERTVRNYIRELNGRGGGKPNFVQGSVAAARGAIEAFFAE